MTTIQQKRDRTQLNSMLTEIEQRQGVSAADIRALREEINSLLGDLQKDLGDAQNDIDSLDIGKADKSEAVVNITQSGGVFTATRADGTTFTF